MVDRCLLLGSGSYLVSQELARQSPEGVKAQEPARQVHQLEFLHLRVDEELSAGQRRNAGPGRVGDVHSCKYHNRTRSDLRQEFESFQNSIFARFSAFEVILICESEADVVAIASGVLAALCDSGTEAGDAATVHTEVALGTVSCKDDRRQFSRPLQCFLKAGSDLDCGREIYLGLKWR